MTDDGLPPEMIVRRVRVILRKAIREMCSDFRATVSDQSPASLTHGHPSGDHCANRIVKNQVLGSIVESLNDLEQIAVRMVESRSRTLYSIEKDQRLFAALRFLWNATRGHRLAPWRSKYLRWRVETYSGQKAESLTSRAVLGFLWSSRWELLEFLGWTGRLEREARKRV